MCIWMNEITMMMFQIVDGVDYVCVRGVGHNESRGIVASGPALHIINNNNNSLMLHLV